MNHGSISGPRLYRKQVCAYHVLISWNELAKQLGITRWTANGGSTLGVKCFGGMNPWDDDIDLTILNCTNLVDLWEKSVSNISHHFPDINPNSYSMHTKDGAIWDAHLISDKLILAKGDVCERI